TTGPPGTGSASTATLGQSLMGQSLMGQPLLGQSPLGQSTLGQCELADGGTLFLDEIADLGPEGQAGLLKLMDDRQVMRVGGTQGQRVDVRVVAGSSVPLAELVKGGRLREDLALRLGVVSVELPPLRDRPADVLPLAEFFLARFARQMGRPGLVLSPAARDRLTAHAWPGNVRELRNLMERVACLAATPKVRPEDLSFAISPERDSTLDAGEPGLAEATSQFQAGYIRRTIARVGGNMSEAARLLELHRSNLYRKMRQLGMDAPRGDGEAGE
ncbi:MAG: sigma 54-interacting transcriptional regulator, partial [Planctomycetaceae bacterium]